MNPYETKKLLAEYLLLHYGSAEDILDGKPGPVEALDFPVRTVRQLIAPGTRVESALDVGCAVGRSTFELSRYAQTAIGLDFSSAFILAAERMRTGGTIPCRVIEEAGKTKPFTATFRPPPEGGEIRFETGDACKLRSDLAGFPLVHAANLICRLPDPASFLARLPDLLASGGQLLLTTPFTWLEEYTPMEKWLGPRDDDAPSTRDVLLERLSPHFELEAEADLPFLIREHARKFQYTIAWGSRWRRR